MCNDNIKSISDQNQIQTSVLKILNVGSAADRDNKKTIHYQPPTQRSVSHILTSEFDTYYMYIYGFAPYFGANCSQKTGRYSRGILHIYTYTALHQILGQIVPKKRADIVWVYYIYIHIRLCTIFWGKLFPKNGQI